MYRQGLGDCFLLAVPAKGGKTKYIVIDCGVHARQTEGTARMRQVLDDIVAATGSHVDVVAATHEHADHLSGFVQKGSPFLGDELTIGEVWLGWTEKYGDDQADLLRKKRGTARRLIEKAVDEARRRAGAGADDLAVRLRLLTDFEYPAENSVDEAVVGRKIQALNLPAQAAGADALGALSLAAAPREKPTSNELALNLLRAKAGEAATQYLEPGGVCAVEDVPHFRAYVLGPPRSDLLKKDQPSRIRGAREGDENEYKEVYLTARAANRALELSPGFGQSARALTDTPEWHYPFPSQYRRPCDFAAVRAPRALADAGYFDAAAAWRRIDGDWLSATEQLALDLSSDTNNTSLVLAFEWGDPGSGVVLLFAADAQVGSWLSWRDQEYDERSADSLLERVLLYKVGHHGSHNATVRRDPRDTSTPDPFGAPFGLELMDDIIAMIPVDWDAAQKKMPDPWKMPHEPLYRKLREKSRRRVLRSDEQLKPLDARAEETDHVPSGSGWQPVPGLKGVRWRASEVAFTAGLKEPLHYEVAIRLPG
jgi:hypothetical protein